MSIFWSALIGAVIVPLAFALLYWAEMRENASRRQQRLHRKKHHDITDIDYMFTYDLNERKR